MFFGESAKRFFSGYEICALGVVGQCIRHLLEKIIAITIWNSHLHR